MLKPYIVIDNILDDPYELVRLSKSTGYFSKEKDIPSGLNVIDGEAPGGSWRGFRSQALHTINPDLFLTTCNQIISKTFKKPGFAYNIRAFLHVLTNDVKYGTFETWHRDDSVIFAGVIYLSPSPNKTAGTELNIDGDIISIENKFNRLLLYDSHILHTPANWLSSELDNKRITLTFFIDSLELISVRGI